MPFVLRVCLILCVIYLAMPPRPAAGFPNPRPLEVRNFNRTPTHARPLRVRGFSRPPTGVTPLKRFATDLWDHFDDDLQRQLKRSVYNMGLGQAVKKGKLALALVDITRLDHPRVAALNGDRMMYAASLPKIAILLAAFEKLAREGRQPTAKLKNQMIRMIRRSSNPDATAVMRRVGSRYIARVLESKRYRLYDREHNGGLWVGKEYSKRAAWRRDPLHNLSHGATALQVARFYYLLETGKLVNPDSSRMMKDILANTAIHHKFKRGIYEIHPNARIYRKSGSWRHFHADSAIIERDGVRYIAVALARHPKGEQWLQRLIGTMDRVVDPTITLARAGFSVVPLLP